MRLVTSGTGAGHMPLQSDNLVAVGLPVVNDQPPVSAQPKLADGIHLRFAFARALGFPWYGYYIFRRPVRDSKPSCLGAEFSPDWKPGRWPNVGATIAHGAFSSDVDLAFVDQFP